MSDPGDLTCQEFVELVTDYLEGALSSPERDRFEAHINDCDDCPLYLSQIQQMVRALGSLREESLSLAARDHLLLEFRDWKRSGGAASTL
jgi:anti-sigma factor RsiW